MRVKKLQVKKGYKRFYDLTIDLGEKPKRIVALVGPNGCGKSSVFDAMLYYQNRYGRIGSGNTAENSYHSLLQDHTYDNRNIIIEFDKGTSDMVFQEKSKEGKQKTVFSFRSPYRYNNELKVRQSKAVSEIKQNSYGASLVANLDQKMEENYRRLSILYNEYLHAEDCRPSEAKAHIIGELNTAIQNCLDLELNDLGNIEANRGTLYFKKSDSDIEFSYNVLSSGEKEVIDILLDLYLRKETYNDTIFIIDEPELHINTSIQRKLLSEINRLVGEDCQLWIATHSIGVLRALQEDYFNESDIIYFDPDNKWASQKYTIEPMSKNRQNWKKIFTTALDDLTHLVSPTRIVYCEGRDKPGRNLEEKGLDAIVYNNIFNEKYPSTVFVSSGGNTELDKRSDIALQVLNKVLTELEVLVLKDRDMASGRPVSAQERDLYLENNPDNHRVLIRWEIENYLYDPEVLEAFCKDKGLEFNKKYYDEHVSNLIDENLKDCTGVIKKSCGITASINSEKFKINLSDYVKHDMEVYKELESLIFTK